MTPARRRRWAARAWHRLHTGKRWLAALIWLDRNGLLSSAQNVGENSDDHRHDGRRFGGLPGVRTIVLSRHIGTIE
jgi:hypothetical protein